MRPIRMTACALLIASSAPLLPTVPGAAAPDAPTAPFRSVELRNGGELVIGYASRQSVTLGSPSGRARVIDGRLLVEACAEHCRHGERRRVTVLTPSIDGVTVSNGGLLRIEGSFPRQDALAASVEQGGTIDIRGAQAARVAASIAQGGRIFTRPLDSLTASVRNGGRIAYWGNPSVREAVAHGGVVERGRPEDEARPLADFDPAPLPPLPELPPLPHHRRSR